MTPLAPRSDGLGPSKSEKAGSGRAGLVHVRNRSGHRAEYSDLMESLFGLAGSEGRIGLERLRRLIAAPRLLLPGLDDDLPGFLAVALLRALSGKRTVGLFIRPQACFRRGLRSGVKRTLFRSLRRVPGLTILSIVPEALEPRLASVSTGSVHDPQLWDTFDLELPAPSELAREVAAEASGTPILSFVGHISPNKGFPLLVELLENAPNLRRHLFVLAAGSVHRRCRIDVARARALGVKVVDRFLSPDDLRGLYAISDVIWCCYDPAYDQASGIFGRAVQTGRPVVVRKGATISSYARYRGTAIVEIEPGDPVGAAAALLDLVRERKGPQVPIALLHGWKQDFVRKVETGL